MNCDQQSATLAWLYGEGDEGHLAHVGSCSACQALVADHEAVLAAAFTARRPRARRFYAVWWVPLTLAASALLVLAWSEVEPAPAGPQDAAADVAAVEVPAGEALDQRLEQLDADLDELLNDLEAW